MDLLKIVLFFICIALITRACTAIERSEVVGLKTAIAEIWEGTNTPSITAKTVVVTQVTERVIVKEVIMPVEVIKTNTIIASPPRTNNAVLNKWNDI